MDVNFVWTQLRVMDYFEKQRPGVLWFMNDSLKKPEEKDRELGLTLSKDLSK